MSSPHVVIFLVARMHKADPNRRGASRVLLDDLIDCTKPRMQKWRRRFG
jgi:hypothetical protein